MKKNILAINGSASDNSSNLAIIRRIADLVGDKFNVTVYEDLTKLPHFKTELTDSKTPEEIQQFRKAVSKADGVLICTPEYVFSIPSGLKNALEWCVSTTVFSEEPVGLITASASGTKGHEELKLIMKTIEAKFTEETTLLIPGVKGKVARNGDISDAETENNLMNLVESFVRMLEKG